jgi:hypothetical protein
MTSAPLYHERGNGHWRLSRGERFALLPFALADVFLIAGFLAGDPFGTNGWLVPVQMLTSLLLVVIFIRAVLRSWRERTAR